MFYDFMALLIALLTVSQYKNFERLYSCSLFTFVNVSFAFLFDSMDIRGAIYYPCAALSSIVFIACIGLTTKPNLLNIRLVFCVLMSMFLNIIAYIFVIAGISFYQVYNVLFLAFYACVIFSMLKKDDDHGTVGACRTSINTAMFASNVRAWGALLVGNESKI